MDIDDSAQVFSDYFSQRDDFVLKVFANANHSMLREDIFGKALGDLNEITRQLERLGEAAFTEGFLETMAAWVEQQAR